MRADTRISGPAGTGACVVRGIIVQSILLALLAIPIVSARDRSAVRGLKKTLVCFAAFAVFYTLLLRFVYPQLS